MARQKNPLPSYQHHKHSDQAFIRTTVNGARRTIYLGKFNSPESKAEYRRITAELETRPPALVAATRKDNSPDITIHEVVAAYAEWARTHYRDPDGKPTREIEAIRWSLDPMRELYGHTPAAEFGPRALATVREKMVKSGLCRKIVNQRVDRIKRMFKWAASEELVPVTVHMALRTLPGLRKGRTDAHDPAPVLPVDPEHVTACLPHFTASVRTIIELLRLTGARPGEICNLRIGEIDRTGDVWVYRPGRHKTAHHGKTRSIPIGPKAQAVLLHFLRGSNPPPAGWDGVRLAEDRNGRLAMADAFQDAGRERDTALLRDVSLPVVLLNGCVIDPASPLFSPQEAREERYRRLRKARKTPVQPSQVCRRKADGKRLPSDVYTARSLSTAIIRAAKKAGVPKWHANQLRHLYATEVRKSYGLEAAQVSLGHSKADVTQIYAERNLVLAAKVAAEIG
jgi:integrase